MGRSAISGFLLIIATTACAPTAPSAPLSKPTASYAERDADIAQCRYEAMAHSNPGYVPPAWSTGHAVAQGLTMGVDQEIRQAQLMELCLRARGWNRGNPDLSGAALDRAARDAPPSTTSIRCKRRDGHEIWASPNYCDGIGGAQVPPPP